MIIMPLFFSSLITRITALRASFSDLAPVQTIFPELKINVAVLGLLRRKTKPGNCSGRYSTPGYPLTTAFRSTRWFRVAEATTFSMFIVALTLASMTPLNAIHLHVSYIKPYKQKWRCLPHLPHFSILCIFLVFLGFLCNVLRFSCVYLVRTR